MEKGRGLPHPGGHPESGGVLAVLYGQTQRALLLELVGGGGDGVASDCLHCWDV